MAPNASLFLGVVQITCLYNHHAEDFYDPTPIPPEVVAPTTTMLGLAVGRGGVAYPLNIAQLVWFFYLIKERLGYHSRFSITPFHSRSF